MPLTSQKTDIKRYPNVAGSREKIVIVNPTVDKPLPTDTILGVIRTKPRRQPKNAGELSDEQMEKHLVTDEAEVRKVFGDHFKRVECNGKVANNLHSISYDFIIKVANNLHSISYYFTISFYHIISYNVDVISFSGSF